jgi:hypothetical protein
MLKRSTVILLFVVALSTQGQQVERKLLPVILAAPLPGAFGSLWATQLTIVNRSNARIGVGPITPGCNLDPCSPGRFPVPGASTMVIRPPSGEPGRFLFVDEGHLSDIEASLRVYDMSREATSLGTTVPVIAETDALTTTANLLGISSDTRFRSLLRVYDFDPNASHSVTVRVYRSTSPDVAATPDALVREMTLSLSPGDDLSGDFPGYAQSDLTPILTGAEGVYRVEISPGADGLRFWALVSVTNDDTQQVTVVTP